MIEKPSSATTIDQCNPQAMKRLNAHDLVALWEGLRHCTPAELAVISPYFLPLVVMRLREACSHD